MIPLLWDEKWSMFLFRIGPVVMNKSDDPWNAFAKKMIETPKIVFTKTLTKSNWINTVIAKGDLKDEITRLKSQDGKDILVYGGA